MHGMPRTCGEASPPPPALQHVTTVRRAVNVRGMPRTCGEASPPQGGLVWGACSLWLSAPRPTALHPAPLCPWPCAQCQCLVRRWECSGDAKSLW